MTPRTRRRRFTRVMGLVATLAASVMAAGALPANAADSCVTTTSSAGWSVRVCLSVADGSPVVGDTAVSATATTSGAGAPKVAKLEFSLRGQNLLTDYEAPYAFTLHSADFVDGPASIGVSAVLREGSVSDPAATDRSFTNGVTTVPGPSGSFTAPSAPASTQTAPLIVGAVGDGAGGESAATSVTGMIADWNPGLVTYLGDVYEEGTITEFRNWYGDSSSWFGQFRGVTAPVVGNHEYNRNGSGGYSADGYFRYWNNIPHYYSFDAGGWHFIALDSTTQYGQTDTSSAQYQWLAADLAARANPCTIVTYHHPLNTIGSEGPSQRMAAIWSLLREHDVTLVLNGHDHNYQHWTPLDADQQPDPEGITQLISGAGGHSSQGFLATDPRVVTKAQAYGALRLEVRPDRVDYSYRTPDGGTGKVLDSGFVPCQALPADTEAPSAPGGVSAVVNASSAATFSATVSWQPASDNRGVAQYKVLRDGVAVATLPGSATSYVAGGLSASSTYGFTVTALDAAGNESAPSEAATATTPAPAPVSVTIAAAADTYVSASAPAKNYGAATTLRLDADPLQHSYVRFQVTGSHSNVRRALLKAWTNNKSTAGFRVRSVSSVNWTEGTGTTGITYNTAPAVGSVLASSSRLDTAGAWVTVDVTPYITGDGLYSFDLDTTSSTAFTLASREAGPSTAPALVVDSDPPPDNAAPTAPTGLTATAAGQSEVDLAWSAATDNVGVTAYTIYRDGTVIDILPATARSYTDTDVGAGHTYTYTVDAVDAAGNRSSASASASVSPPDETPPGLPDPFDALVVSPTTARIVWGASTDNVAVTGYRLYRNGAAIGLLPADAVSYEDTERTSSDTYTYALAARDASGNWSDPATSTVIMPAQQGGQPPSEPTGVTATATGESSIVVEWVASTDDTGVNAYEVYRSGMPVALVNGTTTAWTNTGLPPATSFSYTVKAIDLDANYSAESSAATATTWALDVTAPTVPGGLAGAGASTTSISLSWNPSSDDRAVASYRVYRDGTAVADVPAPTTIWTDSSLSVGESHLYAVDAVDAAGNRSTKTAAISVRTQVPPPVTQIFPVSADAYVNAASPATTYGNATTLRLDGDPTVNSYLKVTTSGLQPVVTSATLHVYANAKSTGGFDVRTSSGSWSEGAITYANAPSYGSAVATAGSTTGAGWVNIPVTAVVNGNGTVTFVLTQTHTTAVAYQSKDAGGSTVPYLDVVSSYQ
jgi:chitodextrinase